MKFVFDSVVDTRKKVCKRIALRCLLAKLSATVTAQLPCVVKIDVQSRCRVLSQRSLEPAYLYGGRLIAISPSGVGMVRKTKAMSHGIRVTKPNTVVK